MNRLGVVACVAALGVLGGSACSGPCREVKREYKAAVEAEPALRKGKLSADQPAHFGLAVRYKAVLGVATKLLDRSIDDALRFEYTMPLGPGKSLKVHMKGQAKDLRLEPDEACDQCFRLMGDLGGDVVLDNPLFQNQKTPMTGSFSFIVPMELAQTGEGKAALRLDLNQLEKYPGTFVSLEFDELPNTWVDALRQPLSKALRGHLSRALKPITVLTFEAPELKVKGLKVVTTKAAFSPKQDAVFVGFTSNLPGIEQGVTMREVIQFEAGEDVRVAIRPEVLDRMVRVGLRQGSIPRRYNSVGAPDAKGALHLTVGKAAVQADAAQVLTTFRLWRTRGECAWIEANASGAASLAEGGVKVGFGAPTEAARSQTDSEQPLSLAGWTSPALFGQIERLLSVSLTKPKLTFARHSYTLTPGKLHHSASSLIVGAKLSTTHTPIAKPATPAKK